MKESRSGKRNQRRKIYIGRAVVMSLTALLLQLPFFFTSFAVKTEDGNVFVKKKEHFVETDQGANDKDTVSGNNKDSVSGNNSKEDDKEPPKLQLWWNGMGQDDYWYRGGEDRFEFIVTAEDNDEDGELTASVYCGTTEEEIEDVSDKKENVTLKDGQASFGSWIYNREGAWEHGDQRRTYVVIVKDQAGNTAKSETVVVKIDETAPALETYDGHPAVYYQFANAVHEKMNDRDRVQEDQIGAYLFQKTLLSRTAVIMTVQVRDGAIADSSSGSGIEKAVLKMNGQSIEPVEQPDGKDKGGTYRFQFPFLAGKETAYRPEVLELTDRAGNRAVYRFGTELALERIVVDGKMPEVDFLDEIYSAKNQEGSPEWYSVSAQGEALRITASARDRYGIYSLEWYMTDGEGNVTQGPLTAEQPGKMAAVPEQTSGAFDQAVLSGTALFDSPQTQLYAVRAVDWAGNATGLIRNRDISENKGSQVNIDNRPAVIRETDGALDVTYCFSNVKYREAAAVRDQALTDQEHMVDGKLVSSTDVRVAVTAEDLPEALDAGASGVKEAVLVTSRGEHKFSLPGGGGGVCQLLLAGAEGEETEYACQFIRITDNAGNVTVCPYTEEGLGSLTIVVDKKRPVQPKEGVFRTTAGENYVRTAEDGGLTGWYSAADGTGKTIRATAEDAYGVSLIRWYALREETDGQNPLEGSLLISETKNPDEGAGAFAHSETFFRDQDQLYGVEVLDWAGNRALFQVNESGSQGSRVCIDNGAPEESVLIEWETGRENGDGQAGGTKKTRSEAENPIKNSVYDELTEHRYRMPGKGAVYGRDHVTLRLYVRDELRDGMRGAENDRISSGIQKISVTVDHDGKKETLVKSNGPQTRRAEIGGKEYLEFVFRLAWSIPERTETEKYIESIHIYDQAGNAASVLAQSPGDSVRYILDNRSPEWKVDYHPGSYVEHDGYPNTRFYREAGEVDVSIRERYFFPEDAGRLQIDCQADGASEALMRSPWEGSGDEHKSVFSMPEDGIYRFSVRYADRSGNLMEGDGVSEGRFTSKYLVLDTKKPVIEVAFLYNGTDITGEIAEKKYYAGPVTAEVKIMEANFDPALTELKASGYSSGDHSAISADWDGPWRDEGEGIHRNTVTFKEQGIWQFACSVKDIAGWEAEKAAPVAFVIDMISPLPEIVFDRNDPEHEKFYREARTALIRVTDRTFHPEEAEVFLTASGQKPAEGEWRHLPGSGCTGEEDGHVDGCSYEMRMTFAEDGDYTLAFRCTDRAGNRSVRAEAAPFTIDRTPPKVTVVYDNMDAANGLYYNRQRQAVITVEERHFHPEDAVITITARREGEEMNPPSISGWTDAADSHSAFVTYDFDGEFTFRIACKDLAGNQAQTDPEDHFIVDLTPPVLEITNIRDQSANNQEVAPKISYSDANLASEGAEIRLTGAANGAVSLATRRTSIPGGHEVQYEDFPWEKELDDLYTLHVSATDLAGNVSEKTVLFSVNRFGSSYLFDSATMEALDRYYLNCPTGLKVTEINVDTLEFREITCGRDGELRVLRPGEDYQVTRADSREGWNAYTYELGPDNFRENGVYTVTIYSEDKASNHSSNGIKEKEIVFAVDTMPPSVVVTGVEDQARYYDTDRAATFDISDNLALLRAEVWLNGKLVHTFDQKELEASGGIVAFPLQSADDWQTLYVKAVDAAGNEYVSDSRTFLITKNLLIQWYRRPWVFWGSVAALTAVVLTGLWLAVRKRSA